MKIPKRSSPIAAAVAFGLGIMLLSWLGDAARDAFYEHTTFLSETFHPEAGELGIRLIFVGGQLVFLFYIVRLLLRQRRLTDALSEASELAHAASERSQTILDALGDGISIQDTELKILYQNPAHRRIIGDHVGEYCYRAYQHRDEPCPGCHLLQSFADGQVHCRETSAPTPHGLTYTEIVSTPLRDKSGKIVAGIEAVRNVNERRKMEAAIQQMNADLQQRAAELEAANGELETFSYSLSHDIRSYLTRIALAAQTLEESEGERLGSEGSLCLQTILVACDGMEELIEAMLTLAHVNQHALEYQSVDLSAVAQTVAGELRLAEPERRLEFDIAPGLFAEGDPKQLRVALGNLLGNASKYSRQRDPARIAFFAEYREGRRVFAVSDNGCGFDLAEASDLFRPFQRLSSGREVPGLGIGLTTVQRVIRRHDGTIWADAEPGRGATFYFTLPCTLKTEA
jgi:signal transduction histidine kinase